MKSIWTAVVAAFSTFSVLPTPRISWDRYTLKGVLCALPLVGAVIGGFCCLYFWLAEWLRLPAILSTVVLTVLPIAVSGGIHMDGFADTVDALSSHADAEKKREILKDPHAGAFAILGVGCYMLLYFGLCAALPLSWKTIGLFGISHVLARATGSLLGAALRPSNPEGMLKTFHDAAAKRSVAILIVWIVLAAAGAALLDPLSTGLMLLACALVFLWVRHTAYRQFGGMSGDLAGYGISLASLAMLLGLVLSERIISLWF